MNPTPTPNPQDQPKPVNPTQQPNPLDQPKPVNPVSQNDLTVQGLRVSVKGQDDSRLLLDALQKMGKNVQLQHSYFKLDNPEQAEQKMRDKLKKSGLYDKLDELLRTLSGRTIEDVIDEAAYGRRYPDGVEGNTQIELKAAHDLADHFDRAVKQMLQDGLLQEQSKATFKWYINTGFRDFLYDNEKAEFDKALSLIKQLAQVMGIPIEETDASIVKELWEQRIRSLPLATILFVNGKPITSPVTVHTDYGDVTFTPLGTFPVKGNPVMCLNFGETVHCYDKNGNEINPANVIMR